MDNNNHPLTDTEIAEATEVSNTYTLTEDEKAQVVAIATEIKDLQAEANAVIKSIARVRGLTGNWGFDQTKYIFTKV